MQRIPRQIRERKPWPMRRGLRRTSTAPLLALACVALAALVAGCDARQVDSTPPTVTYAYYDDGDFGEIQRRADRYCGEQYGRYAILLERRSDGQGYEATFSCG